MVTAAMPNLATSFFTSHQLRRSVCHKVGHIFKWNYQDRLKRETDYTSFTFFFLFLLCVCFFSNVVFFHSAARLHYNNIQKSYFSFSVLLVSNPDLPCLIPQRYLCDNKITWLCSVLASVLNGINYYEINFIQFIFRHSVSYCWKCIE